MVIVAIVECKAFLVLPCQVRFLTCQQQQRTTAATTTTATTTTNNNSKIKNITDKQQIKNKTNNNSNNNTCNLTQRKVWTRAMAINSLGTFLANSPGELNIDSFTSHIRPLPFAEIFAAGRVEHLHVFTGDDCLAFRCFRFQVTAVCNFATVLISKYIFSRLR